MDALDNLSRYKIFLAAAECKSISKAAAQLYISQPGKYFQRNCVCTD